MQSILDSLWHRVDLLQDSTWQWFAGLSREEWLVVLAVTCACGFLSLRGFHSRRL
jgi:hypothetical protein